MFRQTKQDELLKCLFDDVQKKTPNLKVQDIGDIAVGNALEKGAGMKNARIAQLWSGIGYEVPIQAINRACSSGLHALATIASEIKSGQIQLGIAAGVESMTTNPMASFNGKDYHIHSK